MSYLSLAAVPLGGMVLCMAAAHVFLKFAGIQASLQFDVAHAFIDNSWLWAGLLASGFGAICWYVTLRSLPLAVAYPWTALIYVLTPLASWVLFDDVLTLKYMIGMSGIVIGVLLTTRGVEQR
jgi:multidrug transporter EmrE-like cation transporter